MIELAIDNIKVQVPEGTSIFDAAAKAGIEIPALCYDPDLEVFGACRLCVVEIDGDPRPRTACNTKAAQGMSVKTQTPAVNAIRREIIQLLLDNHPNDCLTCQKAGECLLQKYAYEYNVTFRNHDGARRGGSEPARFTDTSSPYILRDESKCILCGKCVRTCAEQSDRAVLSFSGRGFATKIAADMDQTLEASSCVSCSRCVVACPVGALIDRRQREKFVRAFQANATKVVCKQCEYGCEYEVLEQNNERVVRPLAPANGRPLCLTGRLRVEAEYASDLRKPYLKKETENGRQFEIVSWSEALQLDTVLSRISKEEGESLSAKDL